MTDKQAPTPQGGGGADTRTRILETALEMFRERGYDKTTMRAIAAEAGVSVGNAYYYFDSKAVLIQGFYDQIGAAHHEVARRRLEGTNGLGARLAVAIDAWIDLARPYHQFAGTFFKFAAEPTSPLSPFSSESAPARDASIALFAHVLEGSDTKPDPEIAAHLPELLWLLHMGIVLFWVHDSSPDQQRTADLAMTVAPLVERLANLSRLRILRPVTRDALALLDTVRGRAPAQEG